MLKSAVSTGPTRRECVLLALLLLGLLSISRAGFGVWESHTLRLIPEKTSQKLASSHELFSDAVDIQVPTTDSEHWRTRSTWGSGRVPKTTILSHAPGWTIFDNLFLLNGTVFIVTDDSGRVPDRNTVTSTGVYIYNGPEAVASLIPTDRDLRVITTKEAHELFGTSAELIDGTTWIINDPPQFLTHYYHWAAELFLGFWRAYSSLDPSISADGFTSLPSLRRIWFSHADADHWRDYASLNQWILRSVFPSVIVEYSADWQDRAEMGRPVILDRVVFSDRPAAMQGESFLRTGRFASEAFTLPGGEHWWNTIRNVVTKFSGLDKDFDQTSKPVITYVSRQDWSRRKLIEENHEKLVEELYKLRDQYGVEVNVVSMHALSHAEQLRLAARSTIMMGVHGNALTSLVWMKPSSKTAVIEFFYPNGFARDYEYTTRALGMVHYGVWDDRVFTHPEVPPVRYPEGFQGNSIPLNGEVVAKLCATILGLSSETTIQS